MASNYLSALGNEVMVGTITLLYNHLTRDFQYTQIAEVFCSLHVHRTEDQLMEVILVQGPSAKLQIVANEMVALRGIITGRLQLLAAAIPPVYPLTPSP